MIRRVIHLLITFHFLLDNMAVTAPLIRPQDCKDEISFARIIDSAKQYMVIIDGKTNVIQ